VAADRRASGRKGGMIYLDYQATTPLAPEVAEAMRPWLDDKFANPHSPSRWGREAAAAIEVARDQVSEAIGSTAARSPSPEAQPKRSTGRSRERWRRRRRDAIAS
jgi:selenocysteine lyase/cysteine desulfurase